MKEFEIYVLYEKIGGAVVPFMDIAENREIMDMDDYEIDGFWGAHGGLRIMMDGYCVVFESVDFHYVIKVINFLLHTIYLLNRKDASGLFPIDDAYPDDVIVKTTAGYAIHLKIFNGEEVLIQYNRNDTSVSRRRGERFFESMKVNKGIWVSATKIALNEYFSVLLDVLKSSSNEARKRTAMELYQCWLEVK